MARHARLDRIEGREQKLQAMKQYYEELLDRRVIMAKDEILAFLKGGETYDQLLRHFQKGRRYDFWEQDEMELKERIKVSGGEDVFIDSVFMASPFKERFIKIVNNAIASAKEINDPTLLMITDIRQWQYLAPSGYKSAGPSVESFIRFNERIGRDNVVTLNKDNGFWYDERGNLAPPPEAWELNTATGEFNNLRQRYPKDKESAYVVRGTLPDGRIIAHNSTGELAIYDSAEQLDLCRAKLSPARLGQDAVDAPTVADKVETLRMQAENSKADFDAVTRSAAESVGALELHNASEGGRGGKGVPLKDRDQATKKVQESFKGNERFMTDMLRGTIVVSDIPSMTRVIEAIMSDPRVSSVSVQNRINWDGCNDMLLNIRLKAGHTAELQLHIPEIRTIVNEGVPVGADVIEPAAFGFSADEAALVESLKHDEPGRRTLRGDIRLPVFGEPLSSHKLYEIMRSMPDPNERTPLQNALYDRLNNLVIRVHDYGKSQYKARTGLDFDEDFHL